MTIINLCLDCGHLQTYHEGDDTCKHCAATGHLRQVEGDFKLPKFYREPIRTLYANEKGVQATDDQIVTIINKLFTDATYMKALFIKQNDIEDWREHFEHGNKTTIEDFLTKCELEVINGL
jgi:hypothetical protein